MLNEIRELEQYTYSTDAGVSVKRLKHKTLCNDLSGISRAMTIVARKSFFDDHVSRTNKCADKIDSNRIDHAINDLRVWCGDPKGKTEQASAWIEPGWLPEYIVKILGEEKAAAFEHYLTSEPGLDLSPCYREVCDLFHEIHKNFSIEVFLISKQRKEMMDKVKRVRLFCKELGVDEKQRKASSTKYAQVFRILTALNTLSGRYGSSGFNKKMFDLNPDRPEKNDYKKITYEKVIANAITAGPLRQYYLVCERDDFSGISHTSAKTKTYPFEGRKVKNGDWSAPTKTKADLIMKMVSAFLLEQESRDAEELYSGFVPVNLSDILNWLAGSMGKDMLGSFEFEGRPLFTISSIDNVASTGIDRYWMESCGWKVVPEGELDAYLCGHPGAVYFSDFGAGQFMRKNVRYAAGSISF